MKAGFYTAALVGFAMCSGGGIGSIVRKFGGQVPWGSPFMIAGYVLGALALAVIASPFTGWKLPYVTDYKSGLLALVVIVVAKVAVTQTHLVLSK